MDRFEVLEDIGSANFGKVQVMRNKRTQEIVAIKYIERGRKVRFPGSLNICLSASVL